MPLLSRTSLTSPLTSAASAGLVGRLADLGHRFVHVERLDAAKSSAGEWALGVPGWTAMTFAPEQPVPWIWPGVGVDAAGELRSAASAP